MFVYSNINFVSIIFVKGIFNLTVNFEKKNYPIENITGVTFGKNCARTILIPPHPLIVS